MLQILIRTIYKLNVTMIVIGGFQNILNEYLNYFFVIDDKSVYRNSILSISNSFHLSILLFRLYFLDLIVYTLPHYLKF
jgi:hypothetical protein